MRVAGVEKIFLAEMADVRADFARDVQMVVDDEADVRAAGDGQNLFRQATNFIGRKILGAELDQIAAAVAKLLRDEFGSAAMQIGRVHESVKLAIREWFHAVSLAGYLKPARLFPARVGTGDGAAQLRAGATRGRCARPRTWLILRTGRCRMKLRPAASAESFCINIQTRHADAAARILQAQRQSGAAGSEDQAVHAVRASLLNGAHGRIICCDTTPRRKPTMNQTNQ